ncbi:MAG: hypothetical protein LUC94_07240, partial [Clostridiales bacterium]|nr:hypothetical protein [Clostridiales bacterium]
DVTYTATYTGTEKDDPVETYYTISVTAGEGGSITLTAADMTSGGYAVYEIMPDDGYEIDVVMVDGIDATDQVSDGQYIFEDIQEDHTISVTFKLADTTDTGTIDPAADPTTDDSTGGTDETSGNSSDSDSAASRSSSDSDDDSSSSVSSSDASGTWVQDEHGWRYVYDDGSCEAGTVITGNDGTPGEQIAWKQIGGRWWAFGADGYLATGWVFDWGSSLWYYVDETTGMKTGWHDDTEDGYRYYLDTGNGHMLTGWQWIGGKWYYFNLDSESPTWAFDGNRNQWVYNESTSHRPFGSLYIDAETPDGYTVGKDGSREESEEKEPQVKKQDEDMEGGN